MLSLKYIYYFAEITAFLIGCYFYKFLPKRTGKVLLYLLLFVLCFESIAIYFTRVLQKPNVEVYNISTAVELVVYYYLFTQFFRTTFYQQIAKWLILIYPLIWLTNILFIQGFHQFHTYSLAIGSISIIILSLLYFNELLNDTTTLNITDNPAFWLFTGCLFFYAGILVNDFFVGFTHKIKLESVNLSLYRIINNTLNVILYFTYIMFFKCYQQNKNL